MILFLALVYGAFSEKHKEMNASSDDGITDPGTPEIYSFNRILPSTDPFPSSPPPPATTINISYYRSRLSALEWAKENGITLSPDPTRSPFPTPTRLPLSHLPSVSPSASPKPTQSSEIQETAPATPTPYATITPAYRTAFRKPTFNERQELFETDDINFPLPSESPSRSQTPRMTLTNTPVPPSATAPQPPVICHPGATYVHPHKCVCQNAHVGDGRNVCRPPTPEIVSVSPNRSPFVGGAVVSVRFSLLGDFFPVSGLCRFGRDVIVATLINTTALECVAPPSSASDVRFAVSLDGENWSTERVSFYYGTKASFFMTIAARACASAVVVIAVLLGSEKIVGRSRGSALLEQFMEEKHE